MYIRKSYTFRDCIEREEYHNGKYGAPGQKRKERKKATPDEIKEGNRRNRVKQIRRLIMANYQKGDYWTTLTYRREERPPDIETAKKDVQTFLRRLRRKYQKCEKELKYITTVEIGKLGGVHAHLILNRITDTDIFISECWEHGGIHNQSLYEEGKFQRLAEYLSKRPNEMDPDTKKPTTMKEVWFSRSRNLTVIEPKKSILLGATFRSGPVVPKGYYLDKNSLVEGINAWGYKYRYYTLIKIPDIPSKRRRI